MIYVSPKPEPANFDADVRQKGLKFLRERRPPNGDLKSKDYKNRDYWTSIIPELRRVYDFVCAYCCEYIPLTTGQKQVDHFLPKTKKPYELAYEWSNYRLACGLINGRKGTKDIIDPFHIEDGWFIMHFPSLIITPASADTLPASVTWEKINYAITELQLNDEGDNIPSRRAYIEIYCSNGDYGFLQSHAPFLAKELMRQGIHDVSKVREIFNK
jgi:hypothetical protein